MTQKTSKNSNIVGLKELRLKAGEYISRVNKGESFTVVRRSRPVFKIVPVDGEDTWEPVADFTAINNKGVSASELLKKL